MKRLMLHMTVWGLLAVLIALAGRPQVARAQTQELPPGSELPSIDQPLQAVDGTAMTLAELTGRTATVFIFWSNQCPWVSKYEGRVQALQSDFSGDGVQFVLVNANNAQAFPQESLEASREQAASQDYEAMYVRDPNAALAKALGASRTPHVFVFDSTNTLVYAGTIDDSPGDPGNVQKTYLRDALSALVNDQSIDVTQTKAFGCTIKF